MTHSLWVTEVRNEYNQKGFIRKLLERLRFVEYNKPKNVSHNLHVAVGAEDVQTLCGKDKITNVVQVDNLDISIPDHLLGICDECQSRYEEMDIEPEPTIPCHRCDCDYGVTRVRRVPYGSEMVAVCKPCYTDLKNSSKSDVSEPFEDATPVSDIDVKEKLP